MNIPSFIIFINLKYLNVMAKIILNADLYDNVLTPEPGDYTAKPTITGTYHNTDIAADIVAERTEYRQETIENILAMADKKKVQAIANGKSLVDGVGQWLLNLSGPFEGESPRFDPEKHHVGVTFTPGKALLEAMKDITFNLNMATTGPVINQVTDVRTQSVNGQITPGKNVIISGANILLKGDDPSVGIYFTKDEADAQPVKVEFYSRSTNTEQIAEVPESLTDGQYYLSVTTQIGSGYQLVKEPRTYRFPILLTVGEPADDGGDEGGTDSPGNI